MTKFITLRIRLTPEEMGALEGRAEDLNRQQDAAARHAKLTGQPAPDFPRCTPAGLVEAAVSFSLYGRPRRKETEGA